MQYSKQCVDLVKKWEGYQRQLANGDCAAYPDVGSRDGEPVTIGYGTTTYQSAGRVKYQRTKVMLGDTLTKEQAEDELRAELDQVAAELYDINSRLNQNQFDAAVSFFYNCGFPPFQVQRLQQNDLQGFAKAMVEYTKGNDGKVLLGLVNRRQDEFTLWSKGESVKEVTWWAFHRNADGSSSLVGYNGSEPIERHDTNLVDALLAEFKSHKAKTFVVSEKPAPTIGEVEVPKPGSVVATLTRYNEAVKMPQVWRAVGLKPLCLKIGDEEFLTVSGQGYAQNFRLPNDPKSVPGNMEPIPQGDYSIADISWANGKDNYNASHGPGLGPVWVALTAQFKDDRGAFGFHLDSNIVESPGSAGCVVFSSVDELKRFVAVLRKYDPKTLKVNWALGVNS